VDCLDDDRILALLEGRLSAGEERSVEAHLDACGRCRRLLSQVVRTIPDESLADLVPYHAPRAL